MEIELANSNHFIVGLLSIFAISSILSYCLSKTSQGNPFKSWSIHNWLGAVLLAALLVVSFGIILSDSISCNSIEVNHKDVILYSTWSEKKIEASNIKGIEIRYFPHRPLHLLIRLEDGTFIKSCGFTVRDYDRTRDMLASHFNILLDEYVENKLEKESIESVSD